jgi:hypothetical protein
VGVMASSCLTYTPLPDATPQGELDALVAAYKFILECQESRKAADPTGDPNEAKEDKDSDLRKSLPQ